MEGYLLLQESKDFLVTQVLNIIANEYQYAILHHADEIFDDGKDIDLVIDCDEKQLELLTNRIEDKLPLKKINFFDIDKGIYRVDYVFFDNENTIHTIELDCLLTCSNYNLPKFNAKYYLEGSNTRYVKGSLVFVVDTTKEHEYYIKKKAYKNQDISDYYGYLATLQPNVKINEIDRRYKYWADYFSSCTYKVRYLFNKFCLLLKRHRQKPSASVAFLGPDGSGKSTIIDKLFDQEIFSSKHYFHLKPISVASSESKICEDPHQYPPYSKSKSYLKLCYFLYQYSIGWLLNISFRSLQPTLIIFDRYYDDLLADPRRYRFGGRMSIAKIIGRLIPRPDVYFILTTDADIIHNRKQEVSYDELCDQLERYNDLVDGVKYYRIDASRSPDQIICEVVSILSEQRYARQRTSVE